MLIFLLQLVIFCNLGYFFGSVCSAIVVSQLFDLPDPRQSGSKNPGATNVLRLAGKKYAIMVLIADMLKGFIPVLIAQLFTASPSIIGFTALAAVLGHIYPVFFSFKGGKGVATALGALFGMHFMMGVLSLGIWLLIANFFRYSSLASIITFLFAPIFSIVFFQQNDVFIPVFLMTAYIIYQHRQNISRLIAGTEPKISLKKNNLEGIALETIKSRTLADTETAEQTVEITELSATTAPSSAPLKPKKQTVKPSVNSKLQNKESAIKANANTKTTDKNKAPSKDKSQTARAPKPKTSKDSRAANKIKPHDSTNQSNQD